MTDDLRDRDRRMQAKMNETADRINTWSDENHEIGGVCDFCCTPLKGLPTFFTWVLDRDLVAQMSALAGDLGTGTITFWNDPYWAACPACDAVIQKRDPAKLARHAWDNRHERATSPDDIEPMMIPYLTDLYKRFYAAKPTRHEGDVGPVDAAGRPRFGS